MLTRKPSDIYGWSKHSSSIVLGIRGGLVLENADVDCGVLASRHIASLLIEDSNAAVKEPASGRRLEKSLKRSTAWGRSCSTATYEPLPQHRKAPPVSRWGFSVIRFCLDH